MAVINHGNVYHVGAITTNVNMGVMANIICRSIDFADVSKSFTFQCGRTAVTVACNDGKMPKINGDTTHTLLKGLITSFCLYLGW